jgi:hypothetical protein
VLALPSQIAQPVWRYVNLCELRKIMLRFDAISVTTTATYEQ